MHLLKSDEIVPVIHQEAEVTRQEIEPLAYELANAYRSMIGHYRKRYSMTYAEADERVRGEGALNYSLKCPVRDLTWYDLDTLEHHDPEMAAHRWLETKQTALNALESGHWAAEGVTSPGGDDDPWRRAQFLALRESIAQEWQPQGGLEWVLVDTMAQAQFMYTAWLGRLILYSECEAENIQDAPESGKYIPPTVRNIEAMDQAAAMMDRFNRLFLRTLRQLRDLRRYAPQVTIQSAGQVNIGGQQVNLTERQ